MAGPGYTQPVFLSGTKAACRGVQLKQVSQVSWGKAIQGLVRQEEHLENNAFLDWQPVQLSKNWRNMVIFFRPSHHSRSCILDPLQFVDQYIRESKQEAIAGVQS